MRSHSRPGLPSPSRRWRSLAACALLGTIAWPAAAQPANSIPVFVLAGQSNMEGKAQNKLLELQAADPGTAEHYRPYRVRGEWVERKDVFIKFFDRHGPLTIGYGSPDRTGVELAFGTVMGDRLKAPVLIVKTAWGGRSVQRDFRPPSAGMPTDEQLNEELDRAIAQTEKRNEKHERNDPMPTMDEIRSAYGKSYRAMIEEVRTTLRDYRKLFPKLRRRPAHLSGFVWFQGWNDQYGGAELEYRSNLEHLIRDVRRDLEAPELPVVIGVMGQNGSKPAKGPMKVIQDAQLAMPEIEDFQGNVRAVRTDELIDVVAEAQYPTWKENREAWERVGSDHPYHYLGSGIWTNRIGTAFAEVMLELMDEK